METNFPIVKPANGGFDASMIGLPPVTAPPHHAAPQRRPPTPTRTGDSPSECARSWGRRFSTGISR
jgi:hypothetical protein